MQHRPISTIITQHLDALLGSHPADIASFPIPSSFAGATGKKQRDTKQQKNIYIGDDGPIPVKHLQPAMHALNPPDLFIRYTEAYIASPDLFERESVKVALASFIKQFHVIINHIEQGEAGRYMEPAWKPATQLRGDNLSEKSDYMQKIHAMHAMLKNPNLLIAYAVMDAVFRDFYDEQRRYIQQPKPQDVPVHAWANVSGATHVLHDIMNYSGKPDVGFVHGPIMQGYFHHVQRYVNRGGILGNITLSDIREHLGQLSPSGMFDGFGNECPVKGIFVAAALGVGRKPVSPATRTEPRLGTIYMRAVHEALELQTLITTSLQRDFDSAVNNMRGDFKRPQTRALAVIPAGDLSGGQK